MNRGISICILTYNVFFYNRLAIEQIRKMTRVVDYEILVYDNASTDGSSEWLKAQPDVTVFQGKSNSMRHGEALDFLTRRAKYPICCTLCSDAFPVSYEWLTPAFSLNEHIYLAGISRGQGTNEYVCPSYLFGWTEFLKRHTFIDNWPQWDTGEKLAKDCKSGCHQIKTWKAKTVSLPKHFRNDKLCDYNGWVWHTWWSGRRQILPSLIGNEFEKDYHEYVKNMLRIRFQLDY